MKKLVGLFSVAVLLFACSRPAADAPNAVKGPSGAASSTLEAVGTAPSSIASSAATNTKTLTLVDFRDESQHYSIGKPADWSCGIEDDQYLVVKKDNYKLIIWPLKLTGKYAALTALDIANYVGGILKKKYVDFKIEGAAKSQDNSATEIVATYSGKVTGMRVSFTVMADRKGNFLFTGYEAPQADFASMEENFRQMALSYKPVVKTGATGGPVEFQDAGDADVSWKTPKGWKTVTGASCVTKFIQAYDPQNTARRVFIYGGLGPIFFNPQAKQTAVRYCMDLRASYGPSHPCSLVPGQPRMDDMPLAAAVTKEAYLNALPAYFQTEMIKKILPYAKPFGLRVLSKEQVRADEIFEVKLDFDGVAAVGKMHVGALVPDQVTGMMYGYGIVGLTAESKEALAVLYPAMLKTVESLTLSQSFIHSCQELQNAQAKAYAQVSKTLSETSDIVTRGHAARSKVKDSFGEKWSDVTRGTERVFNPDKDEVYSVPNGFYDKYDIHRNEFVQSNLQQLTPSQYTDHVPLDGALHLP